MYPEKRVRGGASRRSVGNRPGPERVPRSVEPKRVMGPRPTPLRPNSLSLHSYPRPQRTSVCVHILCVLCVHEFVRLILYLPTNVRDPTGAVCMEGRGRVCSCTGASTTSPAHVCADGRVGTEHVQSCGDVVVRLGGHTRGRMFTPGVCKGLLLLPDVTSSAPKRLSGRAPRDFTVRTSEPEKVMLERWTPSPLTPSLSPS